MSWYSYRPYVTVAERRRKGEQAIKKLEKQGRKLQPVQPEGRDIATTFWGNAWCDNLEAYSDYANRLPRGRSYLCNGLVVDLQIRAGKITALVQGSDLYKITITIDPLNQARWENFKASAAGKITNLLDLLQGRLGKHVLAEITAIDQGLFPSPKEIHMKCSCPDSAGVCKHLAAVMYGIGTRLDSSPEMFFTLRSVDMQELISAASKTATAPIEGKQKKSALADEDLSELFGVDIEVAPPPAPQAKRATAKSKAKPKPAAKSKLKTKPAKSAPASRKKTASAKSP